MSMKYSRAQIETFVLLQALGAGASPEAVAARLGLHPALHPVVAEALGALEVRGLVEREEDEGCCPTASGEALLRAGLAGIQQR